MKYGQLKLLSEWVYSLDSCSFVASFFNWSSLLRITQLESPTEIVKMIWLYRINYWRSFALFPCTIWSLNNPSLLITTYILNIDYVVNSRVWKKIEINWKKRDENFVRASLPSQLQQITDTWKTFFFTLFPEKQGLFFGEEKRFPEMEGIVTVIYNSQYGNNIVTPLRLFK